MAGAVLLTRVLPGGRGLEPPGAEPRPRGEPLALGVTQVLLGALQLALGGALLVALGEPLGAQLGAPLGGGALLLLSGSVLVLAALGPTAARAKAGLALGGVAAAASFLQLGVMGLLLPYGCPTCAGLGEAAQPIVIYQAALPGAGVGLGEATPPGTAPQ